METVQHKVRTGKVQQAPVVVRVARGGAVRLAAARADEGEGQVAGCIRAVLPYMAQPIALEAPDLVCRVLRVSGGDSSVYILDICDCNRRAHLTAALLGIGGCGSCQVMDGQHM